MTDEQRDEPQPYPEESAPYPYPSYPGYPAYPAYPAYRPPAPKPPPKKQWYLLGVALAVVGVLLIGLGITAVVGSLGAQPPSENTFGSSESTTVYLVAGERKVIYISGASIAGSQRVRCVVSDAAGQRLAVEPYRGSMVLNQWQAAYAVNPDRPGDYTFRCSGADADTFGVGDEVGVAALVGGVLSAAAGLALVLFGLIAAVVTGWLRKRRGQGTEPVR